MACLGHTRYSAESPGRYRLKPILQRDCLGLSRLKPILQRGTSTIELIVAMAVLATAVVGVGRFAATTGQGLHERELSSRIGWELANAREQIGTWVAADINAPRIESLPCSAALADDLEDLRWQAQVVPVSDPAQALRVTLTLHCTLHGQPARPAALVFWVDNQPASNPAPEAATP